MRSHHDIAHEKLPVGLDDAEALRLAAMRANDPHRLNELTTGGMRYIREDGALYSRDELIDAIAKRRLTFAPDLSLNEQYNYLEGLVFVAVGTMYSGSPLGAQGQVSRVRYAATWIEHTNGWRLLLVQETAIAQQSPKVPGDARRRARRRAVARGT